VDCSENIDGSNERDEPGDDKHRPDYRRKALRHASVAAHPSLFPLITRGVPLTPSYFQQLMTRGNARTDPFSDKQQ
jgi:hypothetical protein